MSSLVCTSLLGVIKTVGWNTGLHCIWPYSYPLIIISSYKTTYCYLLHRYVAKMICEHTAPGNALCCIHCCPCSSLTHLWVHWEERIVPVVQQQNGCWWAWTSSQSWALMFKLQPDNCLSFPTAHSLFHILFRGGWADGKGQWDVLIPQFALNKMKNPASGFSCKPSRLLWIKLLNQSGQTVLCCS